MPLLHSRDDSSTASSSANNSNQLSMSPSLIVGICILASIFFCVILATTIRLCQPRPDPNDPKAKPEDVRDLYRPRDPGQLERLVEVRRINNEFAWDRGNRARMELVMRGRRMTVGYGYGGIGGGEEGLGEESENGNEPPNTDNQPHQNLQSQRASHRASHLSPYQRYPEINHNPFSHAPRASKTLQSQLQSPFRFPAKTPKQNSDSDKSDDEEDIDIHAFPYLPGLPRYVVHAHAARDRGNCSPQRNEIGRSNSNGNGVAGGSRLQVTPSWDDPFVRGMTPEPSRSPGMYGSKEVGKHNAGDFENVSLGDTGTSGTDMMAMRQETHDETDLGAPVTAPTGPALGLGVEGREKYAVSEDTPSLTRRVDATGTVLLQNLAHPYHHSHVQHEQNSNSAQHPNEDNNQSQSQSHTQKIQHQDPQDQNRHHTNQNQDEHHSRNHAYVPGQKSSMHPIVMIHDAAPDGIVDGVVPNH